MVILHNKAEKRIERGFFNLGNGQLNSINIKQNTENFLNIRKELWKVFESWKQRPRVGEADSILELDIEDIQDLIEQEQQIRETAIKKNE